MASTGTSPALPATLPFTPGQGEHLLLSMQYSTDDVADTDPLWIDATDEVRAFSTSRGRNSELDQMDAGSASIVLNNRTRTFDPVANPAIRPLNRWRIRAQFSGATQSIFVGYAESYDQQYPNSGKDQIAVVSCADEFMRLALDNLPVTNPPRDSYADVVLFDKPSGYWRMDDATIDAAAAATIGNNMVLTGSGLLGVPAAIVGDPGTYIRLDVTSRLIALIASGDSGDVTTLDEFTVECWIRFSANPAANRDIITGPAANSATTYVLTLLTTGALRIAARNSAGTNHTTDSAVLSPNTFYHVVGTITAGNLRLYINGVQASSTAWTGPFHATINDPATLTLGTSTSDIVLDFDEVATYRQGLAADRVAAHYTAGSARGFARAQPEGERISAIVDASDSTVPVSIVGQFDDTSRDLQGVFMAGQSALDALRKTMEADDPEAMMHIARDGTLTVLFSSHRSVSPYNTVQATFDDDGTDLPYQDVDFDYSTSFLFNDVNVTRAGGLVQSTSDAASISAYGKRSKSLTDVPVTTDTTAGIMAVALLAQYKDPFLRITSLGVNTATAAAAEALLQLDLGSRIRVFRTPLGGGSRIDETLFVQSIAWQASAMSPVWSVTLGVSPL